MSKEPLEDCLKTFLEDVEVRRSTGELFEEACFSLFVQTANELGNVGNLEYQPARSETEDYSVDGWELDGNYLYLAVSAFEEDQNLQWLSKDQYKKLISGLELFVKRATEKDFLQSLEETSASFRIAREISDNYKDIIRINLVLLTNKARESEIEETLEISLHGKPCNVNIFDLDEYCKGHNAVDETGNIEVDIKKINEGNSLPCLRASSNTDTYQSYLTVIPGQLLAQIYALFQTRLLEQNVRVFLREKRATNKGIIKTAEDSPEMFFAYNNGITATASRVDIEKNGEQGIAITKIYDFQIVNGGQTTASLLWAKDTGRSNLENVYVQMKLNQIEPQHIETVVPKIAEYANTQNRILKSDLFSNHPFHKRMQELSLDTKAPEKEDQTFGTYWFYERATGQYANALANVAAQNRDTFKSEYPKQQVITKRDIFKFMGSFDKQPFKVSKGPESLFAEYSKEITTLWDQNQKNIADGGEDIFSVKYFIERVAEAIIFKKTDELVSSNGWYKENRGYKDKIVPYTVSSLVYHLEFIKNKKINLEKVWDDQKVPASIEYAISGLIQQVGEFLQKTPENISNVGEYAKRANCWNEMRHIVSADINVEDADDYLLPLEETLSRNWEDIPKSEFPIQLGKDPKGRTIHVKIAKKGHFYIEFKGENKLQTDIRTLAKGETYNFPLNILSRLSAIELLDKGSRDLGAHPDDEGIIRYEIGTYGAYLTYNQKPFSIAYQHDFRTFSIDEAIEIIDNQK